MQGNTLSCYPVMLPSHVIPSDVTLVGAFYLQDNILSGFPAILPLQEILLSGNITAVAVVRMWYNKTIVALARGYYDDLFTLDSECYQRA